MAIAKKLKNSLFKDGMLVGAGVMSVGVFTASIFNYLTQVFLGRNLNVEDFGTFNSLFSLTVLLTIPSTAMVTSMIKTVASLRLEKKFNALTQLFVKMSTYTLAFGGALSLVFLASNKVVFRYLNIENNSLVVPYAVYVVFMLLNTTPRSYLQGLLRYKAFSFFTIFGTLLKLLLSILLVLAGYRVAGAFYAFTTAVIINFILSLLLLKKNFRSGAQENLKKYYKKFLTFGAAVLLTRASLTALSNVDQVLVKHFFNPTEAGIYSAIATIGKVIIFGTGIVSSVMFPIVSNLYASKDDYFKKFLYFFGAQIVLVIGGVSVFMLMPKFITLNMFGKGYISAVPYLARFAIYAGLFALVNFIYQFLLATEKTTAFFIILVGTLVQFILINTLHTDLNQIININIGVMSAVLASSLVYLFKTNLFQGARSLQK